MSLPFPTTFSRLSFGALVMLLLAPLAALAEDQSAIRLQVINGRTWLVDADGRPFFAHGVTHLGGHAEDVAAIGQSCRELGFNAWGYGCPPKLKPELPYLEGRQFVPMSLYRASSPDFGFVDIFDPSEQSRLTEEMRKLCFANRQHSTLIGYCWTDLGAWPLMNSTGRNWVEFIRALPADSPGQKAYREFLADWQGNDQQQRDLGFLRIIAREYFRVLGEANRRFDPDHLIFGDRLTFETAIPEVVEEMLPWVDAIAIQPPFNPPFPRREYDRVHQLSGKPIIICDFAIRFQDGDKEIRGWKPEESPAMAGERYAEYVREAIATPYILGCFWCNPIDSTPSYGRSGIKQGIFDKGLAPRPDLNAALRELNEFLSQQPPAQD